MNFCIVELVDLMLCWGELVPMDDVSLGIPALKIKILLQLGRRSGSAIYFS